MLKQGDVITVYLSGRGEGSSVQQGYRPCVIVNEIISKSHPIFIVSPITRSKRKEDYPFVQEITISGNVSQIHYEQFFTITADHTMKVRYSMTSSELIEMQIKSTYCFGLYRFNPLNIEQVQLIAIIGDYISGRLVYHWGESFFFKLLLSDYENTFGIVRSNKQVWECLSTLRGLQYIFKDILGGLDL